MLWLIPIGVGAIAAATYWINENNEEEEHTQRLRQEYWEDLQQQKQALQRLQQQRDQEYQQQYLRDEWQAHQRALKPMQRALKNLKANLKAVKASRDFIRQELDQLIGVRQGYWSEADAQYLDNEISQQQEVIAQQDEHYQKLRRQKKRIQQQIEDKERTLWHLQGQLESPHPAEHNGY